jgi:hypothetical protein
LFGKEVNLHGKAFADDRLQLPGGSEVWESLSENIFSIFSGLCPLAVIYIRVAYVIETFLKGHYTHFT